MSDWNPTELARIGDATELRIASTRADGTLRPWVTIWHGVVDGVLYVRSAHGPENGWYRRARAAGTGRVAADGVEQDVTFTPADATVRGALDAALHAKYDRFGPAYVGAITGDDVLETTLRVDPR
ncbi:MAG: DUF2255 domain-containing protein [Microbacterium sp.]|uniref:DUF2255 domain-containing protein n=2 Tax=Microbacterium ginsengisoli TaxID=400772 RepID=A0A0F0LXV5_9MICO|nr:MULTISPECIES: DUF2255 family protein [Microbacterium]KJL36196.1 hypothetical protein RR49_01876 [Microbacterium ginsengisoli]MAL06340.1 DUF2255 domain-containing protein [Microbacterium sp.]MBN9208207.1 DUF2255 family protein [Microbacterium ginsengisoli]MCK9919784.1 DUF2255 family protein [Microbacteriaceae bacterium K1510]